MTPERPAFVLLAALAAGCTMPNPAFVEPRDAGTGQTPGNGGHGGTGTTPGTGGRAGQGGVPAGGAGGASLPDAGPVDRGVADLATDRAEGGFTDVAPPPARRIVIADALATNSYGGSGGVGRSEKCATGQVLIGFRGNTGTTPSGAPVVSSLQARCGTLTVTPGHPYKITSQDAAGLQAVGAGTNSPFTAICPAGQVLVSFFGRAGSYLDQVGFRCAALLVADDAALTISLGPTTNFGAFPATTGGNAFNEGCGTAGVATGQMVNEGNVIDAFGLHCGRPSLVP